MQKERTHVVIDLPERAFPSVPPANELTPDATVPSGANVVLETLSLLPSSKCLLPLTGSDCVSIVTSDLAARSSKVAQILVRCPRARGRVKSSSQEVRRRCPPSTRAEQQAADVGDAGRWEGGEREWAV